MRNIKNIYMATLLMMAISACSVEKEQPFETEDGSKSFTITANIPTEIWGEVTRSYTDESGVFKLHFIDYKGERVVYPISSEYITSGTTHITINKSETEKDKNLVWERIQNDGENTTMHLTVINGVLGYHMHASAKVSYGAEDISFDLKPSMAKLTLELSVNDGDETFQEYSFNAKISGKEASDSYDPWTDGGVWPTSESQLESITLSEIASQNVYVYGCEKLLPQQTLGDILTLTYGPNEWYLDLSEVNVTDGKEGQMANQVYAGQNLTLSLQAYINDLNAPTIVVTAFVEEDKEVGGDAEAGYVYDEATKTYTVHNEHGLLVWLNAYIVDPTVQLAAYEHFDLSNIDLDLPKSFLHKGMDAFAVDEKGVLTLAERQWKSISIIDDNGTDVLGTYGVTNGYPTMTIGDKPYYVISANLERTAEVFNATCTSLKNFIDSYKSSSEPDIRLYIVGEMSSIYEGAPVYYPKSMIGGALWYVYQYDEHSYSLPSVEEIILADATTVINRAFLVMYHVNVFSAPKVTVVQSAGFEDASVGTFKFGSVITNVGSRAFHFSLDGEGKRPRSSLILCEDQKNSESLKPDAESKSWAGYTWNNISFQ